MSGESPVTCAHVWRAQRLVARASRFAGAQYFSRRESDGQFWSGHVTGLVPDRVPMTAAESVGPRLLADWSEFEVHMKTSPRAGWDRPEMLRHDRAARRS